MKALFHHGYTTPKTQKSESLTWAAYMITEATEEELEQYMAFLHKRDNPQFMYASEHMHENVTDKDLVNIPMYVQTQAQLQQNYGATCKKGEEIELTFNSRGNVSVYVEEKSTVYQVVSVGKTMGLSKQEIFDMYLKNSGLSKEMDKELKESVSGQRVPAKPISKEKPIESVEKSAKKSTAKAKKKAEGLDTTF